MRKYIVTYKSRYHPLEGSYRKAVYAPNKQYIRNNWHSIIETDEYRIVSISAE